MKPLLYLKLGLLIILFLLIIVTPSFAASIERIPLTVELLQDRLKSPIQSEGVRLIDLRDVVINLRPDGEFRDRFYQLIQNQLNRPGVPIGLDLSNSIIQGDLIGSKFGLRSPLYGQAMSPLLTPEEQQLLLRDPKHLSQPSPIPIVTVFRGTLKLVKTKFTGTVDFSNCFFLHRFDANNAAFLDGNWSQTRWIRPVDFTEATFNRDVDFSNSLFFDKSTFSKGQFRGTANFEKSIFENKASFKQADFARLANWVQGQFQLADFSQTKWRDRVLFSKGKFAQSLLLNEASFEKAIAFRETQFNNLIDWQGVSLLEQADFSNARFLEDTSLNVAGLTFDSESAKILGDTGEIGRVLSVPVLKGNEDVLRNLVRNFRSLQQIADANQIEYKTQQLQQKQLANQLKDSKTSPLNWVLLVLSWVGLSLLLLLSRYGTSFGLVFGVGCCAIAYFGLLFWLVDRFRRRTPQAIIPTKWETPTMLLSYAGLTCSGVTAIFRTSDRPWLTLAFLGVVILPLPMLLLWRLYQQGRYHDLMDVSYFVEDGSLRQLRLLIGRLPVMPRFPLFRDRYMPILWDRRWNWLNYYDFSLNNLLKIGFNDIRLRDLHLPGLITTLVWYQWGLGVLYIALLLWTLSRTIPGLNLLIYLK